jgi:hypothetical protein
MGMCIGGLPIFGKRSKYAQAVCIKLQQSDGIIAYAYATILHSEAPVQSVPMA